MTSSYPPPPPQGGQAYAPNHPQATTALVLGILSLVICGLLGPFAWSIGAKALREIDASGGTMGGRGSAVAGKVCGIIGTCLLGLGVLIFLISLGGMASNG
jgi:TRAP-type C4-dicarboxylate transport system permease small subunit